MEATQVQEISRRTRRRVELGARLLDEHLGPGWEDRINLDQLQMSHACMCILGQLFTDDVPTDEQWRRFCSAASNDGSFYNGLPYYHGLAIIDGPILTEEGAMAHGFHAETMADFDVLGEAWREKIEQLRCERESE